MVPAGGTTRAKRSKDLPHDPFYSQEMVALADEAQKQLKQMAQTTSSFDKKGSKNDTGRPSLTSNTQREFKKMAFKTAGRGGFNFTKGEILDKMHELRLETFEERVNDPMNVKPYLPMLSSDEREVIMEQYFASKKKLSK